MAQRIAADGSERHDGRVDAPTLERASLRPHERRVLERFVELLRVDFGGDLRSVWLYGSRARGEPPHDESDIDLIVVTSGGRRDERRVDDLLVRAADAEGASWGWFSVHVFDPQHIARRREIRSFFIQEVDREKIVLAGEP
jgi:predicted nucleotidyltransferase